MWRNKIRFPNAIRNLAQQTTDANESQSVTGTCLPAGRFKELTAQYYFILYKKHNCHCMKEEDYKSHKYVEQNKK
jgi:hypothetical protein